MMFTSGTQALQGRTVNHDPKPRVNFGERAHARRVLTLLLTLDKKEVQR